jgi:beta-barrel assembly-enhancing protease
VKFAWAILLLLLCSTTQAAPNAKDVAAYRALVAQDLRLAVVSYRLVSANAPFCKQLERNPGWVLHDEQQYPDRETAQAAFGLRLPIAVAAVVPDGAADKAGVRTGDGLAGVNGSLWVWAHETRPRQSSVRIESVQKELRQALAEGPAELELETLRGIKRLRLDPPQTCASRFWVDASSKLDAGTDGDGVRVTEGLMAFAGNDDGELAAIVAHELSHNLLGHRERLKANGGTKAVLATEIEADRLSVWLMANAGYDPKAALRFAERYGRKTGLGIFSDGTHLRWRNRVKVMQAEIDVMAKTAKRDGLLPPPLLTGR